MNKHKLKTLVYKTYLVFHISDFILYVFTVV